MNRKDDHIKYSLNQKQTTNDFDLVDFVHHSIPSTSYEEINLSTKMFGKTFDLPIYINAMTGGTSKAETINKKLAMISKHFNIPMAVGSLSYAIKGIEKDSYNVIRKEHPNGFILANIGADKTLEDAQKAIQIISADALQIHVNALQEIIMPEGERDFKSWESNIENIVNNISIPVIVKEVGFGMSKETIETLKKIGVKNVDVSGKGGTNFAMIENNRLETPMHYLNNHGLSTVQSLLEASTVNDITIYASGGVRNPFDVVKALALGADAVGMSGYFLKLVEHNDIDTAISQMERFVHELKLIMVFLNCNNIETLREKDIILHSELINYLKQRNIKWRN